MNLETEFGDKKARSIVKNLFISVFINGADVDNFFRKNSLSQHRSKWNHLTHRYRQTRQYIDKVNAGNPVTGFDGIERTFRSDDNAAFSKFIQSQAAYIFKHVFTEIQKDQHLEGYEVVLPVHDALIIGAESEEGAQVVKKKLLEKFEEVTGVAFAQVTIELFGKKDDVYDMER